MEIERKFLIDSLPGDVNLSACKKREIEQGYLCTSPVVRVRRDNDDYYLTYKGGGLMAREEYNLPLTRSAYDTLLPKSEGNIITKTRYEIPDRDGLIIELDYFHGVFEGLVLAEVEFPSIKAANSYRMPDWFTEDVTENPAYHNSNMAMRKMEAK